MTELNPLRRRILEVGYRSGEPQHYASALSILPIVWTLYDQVMRPGDLFVLAKAHGCMALYAVLEAKGVLPPGEFEMMGKRGARLGGHPGPDVPGIEFACGSLGHGEPASVGLAYAKQLRGEPGLVFCLTSDGAMQEGSVLEAIRLSRDLELANLRFIVDDNRSHDKLGLPWNVAEDSWLSLSNVADRSRDESDGNVFLVETIKGDGIPAMEKEPNRYHRAKLTPQEYRDFMEGLT